MQPVFEMLDGLESVCLPDLFLYAFFQHLLMLAIACAPAANTINC